MRLNLSACPLFYSVTMAEMGTVIKELEKNGLRKGLKVTIAGAPITREFAQKIGADYAVKDAVGGVHKCKVWAE